MLLPTSKMIILAFKNVKFNIYIKKFSFVFRPFSIKLYILRSKMMQIKPIIKLILISLMLTCLNKAFADGHKAKKGPELEYFGTLSYADINKNEWL